jgi:serine protease
VFLAVRKCDHHAVRTRLAGVVTLVGLASISNAPAAPTSVPSVRPHAQRATYSAERIVVRVRPGVDAARLRGALAARGLSLGTRIPHTRLFTARTHGRSPAAAIRSLSGEPTVAAAVPDYVRHAFEIPNDPFFELGEGYLTTVRLPQAWDISHSSGSVIIAVVDTGVTAVPDLGTQVLPGRNFVVANADARDDSSIGHGTLVAGVAAATTNNGIGIAGAAWNASVLPVKVLNARGFGEDSQIVSGIVWAVDQGARVVNLSLGGPGPGQALCDAVSYAESRGALVVAAAGNSGTQIPNYPAACPGAVAVSATDTNGDLAYFSSYGTWVSLAAPGVRIVSTRSDNSYGSESGTSFSAPMVSAVAALVLAQHPDWNPSRVATQLEDTAQDRGVSGGDPYYGHGLLDAYAALGGAAQAAAAPVRDALEPNDTAAEASTLFGPVTATISPEADVDWYLARVRWPCILSFEIQGPPADPRLGPNFRPVLQVYDEEEHLLVKREDGLAGQRTRITATVPAGRYYLRVANRGASRSPGSYSVKTSTFHLHRVLKPLLS